MMKPSGQLEISTCARHSPARFERQGASLSQPLKSWSVIRMRRRTRKLIGTVAILVFVSLYALIAMAIAQGRLQDANKFWQGLYYLVAGMGWILPIMPLIRWMERPDETDI
jgi:hypothetical protein